MDNEISYSISRLCLTSLITSLLRCDQDRACGGIGVLWHGLGERICVYVRVCDYVYGVGGVRGGCPCNTPFVSDRWNVLYPLYAAASTMEVMCSYALFTLREWLTRFLLVKEI